MGDIVLETERLVLRKIDEGDAALQYRLLNTPAVMEHLGGVKELHEIEAKHARTMASFARDGFGFMLMVEKASGELVGHAGLKRVDHPKAPNLGDFEIGWLVREDRWRRGYAGEAMRAVIDWAFTRHRAPRPSRSPRRSVRGSVPRSRTRVRPCRRGSADRRRW